MYCGRVLRFCGICGFHNECILCQLTPLPKRYPSIPQVGIGGGSIPVDAMQSGKKAQLDPNDFHFGTQDLMPVKLSKPIEDRPPPFPGADWPY